MDDDVVATGIQGWKLLAWVVASAAAGCGRIGFDSGSAGQVLLTLDNGARAEALVDIPVLVVLDSSRIDYSRTEPDGSDLGFVDPDGTRLPYELETWDPAGVSFVWVRVPQIDASSTTDHITLVFGDTGPLADQDPTAVWAGYAGVWHFAQAPGVALALDSSSNANHGEFRGGMTAVDRVPGRSGPAIHFDGVDDFIEIPDSDSLDLQTFTLEAWVLLAEPLVGESTIVSKDGVGTDPTGAYDVYVYPTETLGYETNNQSAYDETCCVRVGAWRGIAVTLDAGPVSHHYIDGVLAFERPDFRPRSLFTSLLVGRRGVPDAFTRGAIDELRLAPVAHTPAWMSAQNASVTDTLITYGPIAPFSAP